jgi:hypothetical protein
MDTEDCLTNQSVMNIHEMIQSEKGIEQLADILNIAEEKAAEIAVRILHEKHSTVTMN